MSYSYYKAYPIPINANLEKRKKRLVWLFRILPNVLIVVGATAVVTVMYPFISYQLITNKWSQRALAVPVPSQEWDVMRGIAQVPQESPTNPAQPVMAYQETNKPQVVNLDYTDINNWFAEDSKPITPLIKPKIPDYSLSIPKVNIENMQVVIGGKSLDKSLIHYQGTAFPGEYGNPVIFGHSVLPIFYNPKSYMSIFSKLPTLEKGDEIFITYDGVTYKYVVESYHEVEPSQVEVLEQRYDRQTLTLITCVPPGTYLRRGVILAVLEKY